MLQQCSGLGAPNMFACTYHYVFVLDHNGIVRYRGTNLTAANLIIGQALDVLRPSRSAWTTRRRPRSCSRLPTRIL